MEEYLVAVWFEQHKVQYLYQALMGGYRAAARVDFLIPHLGLPLVIQVMGDHFHDGIQEVEFDRQQRLRIEEQGATVIECWGHDIVAYDGYPVPTDESFDKMMVAALSFVQISTRSG